MNSTVFAEVELGHHWTLQPPLAAYRDIHRSISVCSWCHAGLNEVAKMPQDIAGIHIAVYAVLEMLDSL